MNLCYKFLCLPLLPANEIDAAFYRLKTEAENFDNRLFKRFLLYFESQWIKKVKKLYRSIIATNGVLHCFFFVCEQEGALNICVHDRSSRTTNALEAYNGHLSRQIQKKGHFFKFLEEIKEQEFRKSVDFANLIQSGAQSAGTKRIRVWFSDLYFATMVNLQLFCYSLVIKRSKIKRKNWPEERSHPMNFCVRLRIRIQFYAIHCLHSRMSEKMTMMCLIF